jgi:hypothetical protein
MFGRAWGATGRALVFPEHGRSLRPKAEANLGGGLIGRSDRRPFRPRSRQKSRLQGAISAAAADACETDIGRFRPEGLGAAGLVGQTT